MIYDVAVIGAGVIGSMISMELSHYNLSSVLIERFNDVAMGTTKANSAIVHAGFDAMPGTLKAKFNVEGTKLMPGICKTLHVPFKQCGSVVVAFYEEQLKTLQTLYERGIKNGVPDMEIIDRDKLRELEPHINEIAKGALYAKTAGVVCPYQLAIASAENAVLNGTKVELNYEVEKIDYDENAKVFSICSGDRKIEARYIVNCAGIHSGKVASLIGDNSIEIVFRKGEYMLLDKNQGHLANTVIFQCPSEMGKGILVTKTVDGNVITGPSSIDIGSVDEDLSTNSDVLDSVVEAARLSVPEINTRNVITSFAGLRAHSPTNDFIIGESDVNPSFINVAGIESPGLSAAPAIGIHVKNIIVEKLGVSMKEGYELSRKAPVRFNEMTNEQKKELIAKDKRYGRIICRCETVTEGEILDAIHSPIPATDVDGVKRRTRAGMGRCQGGFCGSKVVELLAREHGLELDDITKFGGNSKLLVGKTK